MLRVRGVEHGFAGRPLFSEVDHCFDSATATAIVGPSGIGKSTFLHILAGHIQPTAGQIANGFGSPALVLQSHHALPSRSVLENALLYRTIDGHIGLPSDEDAVSVLTSLGMESHLRSRCRTLSGGELQRVAVARALLSRRQLILADEPTSHLDRGMARTVMSLLHNTAADGRSVVIVTHDTESLPPDMTTVQLGHRGLTAI